jgi:hypothetical protein
MPRRRQPANPPTPPHDEDAVDAARMDELVAAIRPLAEGLRALYAQVVAVYRPEVDAIIASRSRDRRRIEHTLDGLLSVCGDDEALAVFKRLCRYYWKIDPAATADYVYAYRDMWDDAGDAAKGGATASRG